MIHNEFKFCGIADIRHFVCATAVLLYVILFFHIDSLVFTQRIYLISNKRTVFVIRPVYTLLLFFFLIQLYFVHFILSVYESILFGEFRTLFHLYCCAFVYLPSFVLFRVCDFKWMHFSLLRFFFDLFPSAFFFLHLCACIADRFSRYLCDSSGLFKISC